MKRRPRGLIIAFFVLMGLAVLVLILHASITVSGKRGLERRFAEIRARGEPLTFEELAPRPVPIYENAAPIYEQAFKALKLPERDENLQKFLDEDTSPEDRAKLEPGIRELIQQNEPVFALIEEAVSKPKCVFPVKWEDGLNALHLHSNQLRKLNSLVSARAILRGSDGQTDAALQDLALALRIADAIRGEPDIESYLVSAHMRRKALFSLKEVVSGCEIDENKAASIYQMLSGISQEDGLLLALQGERAIGNWHFDRIRKADRNELWGDFEPSQRILFYLAVRGYSAISYKDQQFFLDSRERWIKAVNLPYSEVVKLTPSLDEVDKSPLAIMSRTISGTASRAWAARDAVKAEIGLAQTAMALKAYKSLIGSYPASLQELKTRIDWPIPDDPFSGKPFVYKRNGQGFLLYSWGINLKDDGGKTTHEAISAGDINRSDLVWKCER